ncbi:hypothetical protein RRF57_010674 [Xylaria bambusicola]|uniref:Uncharacterized protein n=1 Tax=Xylaria bambusicola TaxID=326684 RepID=A0AAN7UST3_9PEZI
MNHLPLHPTFSGDEQVIGPDKLKHEVVVDRAIFDWAQIIPVNQLWQEYLNLHKREVEPDTPA